MTSVGHLFLVQTHKDPDHILRLALVLRQALPDSFVLISHDVRAAPLPAGLFGDATNIAVISGRGGRGDFTIVDGYLAALRWLDEHQIAYRWLTNLSGSDYPVMPLAAYQAELDREEHDGYLHHFDALKATPEEMAPYRWPARRGSDQYLFQYRRITENLTPWQRKLIGPLRLAAQQGDRWRVDTAYGLMFGRRAGKAPFGAAFRPYAGSYWHTISGRAAKRLSTRVAERGDIVEYYRKVLIPDEGFIQTMLVNEADLHFLNDNRRYFDFSASRIGHPRVLDAGDVPILTTGAYAFGRKLEPSAGTALFDRLDAIALGADPAIPRADREI